MPFGMITAEQLAAWFQQQGIQPAPTEPAAPPEPIVCEICETELDDPSVEIEGPPPANAKRYFHTICLNMHLIRNEDNAEDELTAFITRKIPCSTAT